MSLDLSKELERFRHRLLDLTNRNPLLNFRKSKVRTLQVVDELPDKIFERLIGQNKKFRFLPMPDADFDNQEEAENEEAQSKGRFSLDLPFPPQHSYEVAKRHTDNKLQTKLLDDKLDRVLNRINREAIRSKEETGVNYLHLALGFVEWRDKEGSKKPLLAPLMLIPIRIERGFDERQGKYAFSAAWTEEEVKFNISLAKRIENDFGVRIPRFESDEEPEKYFARVADSIRAKSEWRMKRECVVGFFSFHKLMMYNDLEAWTQQDDFHDQSVISQLVCGSDSEADVSYVNEYAIDDLAKKDDPVTLVLDADSSQHSALLDICQGQNLVIEGPPGTGKSQTITNAIAALVAQGKSVLFVAEKLAALNVVKTKLDNLGLGDFCLELHSDGATPRSVIRSLESRIYGNFPEPRQLQEIERKLADDKTAIREYLAASETTVGPGRRPLHEVVWGIVDLRSRGLEPLFGYKGGARVTEDEFKESTEALDSLAHALSDLSSPRESKWTKFSADRIRPNLIARVKTILSQMKSLVEGSHTELVNLCERFGGTKEQWDQFIQPRALEELDGLAETAPAAEFECEKLLDGDFMQSLGQAQKLIETREKAHQEISQFANINADQYALSGQIRKNLEFLLPAHVGQSIADLKVTHDGLPSVLRVLGDLEEKHQALLTRLIKFETPDWYTKVDQTFVNSLKSLAASVPPENANIEDLLDSQSLSVAEELCQKFKQLEDIQESLSQQGTTDGAADDLTRFSTEVLQPLIESLGDQTIRSLERTKNWITEVADSLESMSDVSIKLERVGFRGVKTLSQLQKVEAILKLYEHPVLNATGPVQAKLFDPGTVSLYRDASSRAEALRKEEADLGELFHLPSVPELEQLKEIQTVLRRSAVSPLRFVQRKFWAAKNQLAGFRQPKKLNLKTWLLHLGKLEKHLAAKVAFADSEPLAERFGAIFTGMESDWETIGTLVRWVATLKKQKVDGSMHLRIIELCGETSDLARKSLRKNRKQLESYLGSDRIRVAIERASPQVGYRKVKVGSELEEVSPETAAQLDLSEIEATIGKLRKQILKLDSAPDSLDMDGTSRLSDLIGACSLIDQQHRLLDELSDAPKWHALGVYYNGLETKHNELKTHADWLRALKALRCPPEFELRLVKERDSLLSGLADCLSELLVSEKSWHGIQESVNRLKMVKSKELPKSIAEIQQSLEICNEAQRQISSLLTICDEIGFDRSKDIVDLSRANNRLTTMLESTGELAQNRFLGLGSYLSLLEADKTGTLETVSWTKKLAALSLPADSLESVIAKRFEQLSQIQSSTHSYIDFKRDYRALLQQLTELGEISQDWLEFGCQPETGLDELVNELSELSEDTAGLEAWAGFCRARTRCAKLKLDKFVDAVIDESLNQESVASTYRLTVLENAVGEVFDLAPTLSDFTRHAIEVRRKNLKERDRSILKLNRSQIAYQASRAQPPAGNSRGRVAEKTEMGLIKHEIGKQTRHVQIRSLLQRSGQSVKKLKPCFMMSPLSVSQFLDPENFNFDVVIMDEASQIKPEDALGAVLRAKQLVVVGDPKQLPPTSFFDRSSDEVDEEEETQFDDNESILEVAMKTFHPIRRLRWHYRSQHESLIRFSNDRFYDGDLVIFPSSSKDSGALGVYQHYIEDGSFSKGLNHAEADAVANAIAEHARYCPGQSLGVGTFNMKQATLIQDKLDVICENDNRVRLALENLERDTEKLFIKNLENLQGDERDVIFISYTYGPDPNTGKVFNRFGPLAGEGGWRRLNVMVSRARKRVEVFSSIRPSDIKAGEDKSRGVNAFRDYLEFAESGAISSLEPKARIEDETTEFEESIIRLVEDYGLKCKRRVGVAGFFVDIGVVSPYCDDTFLLGIVTDGDTYRSAKSARDRDRLRDEVISSRNWKLHRVWSADWFLNQQNEERRLIDRLDEVLSVIPREFRRLEKVSNEDERESRFEDLDICDQIVAYLKEFLQGSASQIAEELNQTTDRILRLLIENLSPFVHTEDGFDWEFKPGMIEEVGSAIETTRETIAKEPMDSRPGMEGESIQVETQKSSAELIVKSKLYQNQKQTATRIVVNDLVTAKILFALEKRDWKATVVALSDAVEIPPFRLRGMLPGIQRLLNIDGQQVMTICRDSDTVELNEALVIQEFLTE